MFKDNSQKRLLEVVQKLDARDKSKLNENFGGNIDDPTKEEMVNLLTKKFHGLVDPMETDGNEFDVESAIYWFANDYHGGQNSNLYSALSTSQYRPGPMHKSIEDDESETATMMYQELVDTYGGTQDQEVDNSQWMGMSMNEKDVSVREEIQYPSSDEYKGKVEKLKQTMDTLFNDEYYDVIDTLFKLLVSREKGSGQIASLTEDISIGVEVGDTIMMGKFKNSPTVVKTIGKDEHGMPTINGKKVATFRMATEKNEK